MTSYDKVVFERNGTITTINFNRPHVHNALDRQALLPLAPAELEFGGLQRALGMGCTPSNVALLPSALLVRPGTVAASALPTLSTATTLARSRGLSRAAVRCRHHRGRGRKVEGAREERGQVPLFHGVPPTRSPTPVASAVYVAQRASAGAPRGTCCADVWQSLPTTVGPRREHSLRRFIAERQRGIEPEQIGVVA